MTSLTHAVQHLTGSIPTLRGVIAQAIKESLDRLPGGERTQIGFLTFDSTLHFYNLKSSLTQPQMMVSADTFRHTSVQNPEP